jgi:hypothetical protein
MHAEGRPINSVSIGNTPGGESPEGAFLDDQVELVRDFEHWHNDHECAVVNKAVGQHYDMHFSCLQLTTLDLHRDVTSFGHVVQDRVEAAVEQRKKRMQQAM